MFIGSNLSINYLDYSIISESLCIKTLKYKLEKNIKQGENYAIYNWDGRMHVVLGSALILKRYEVFLDIINENGNNLPRAKSMKMKVNLMKIINQIQCLKTTSLMLLITLRG